MKYFTWKIGRQNGDKIAYRVMTFYWFTIFRYVFDFHLIKVEPMSIVPPHKDPFDGKHYRMNIHLNARNAFHTDGLICQILDGFIVIFRPDLYEHSFLHLMSGSRNPAWILSFGFAIKDN